ncbi:MAG: bifunctional helix-turn-helix transcriptional regulator/GNAT family N-acetyltransferase [Ignavibacteria bacterium]|jgi:DNA-binding MarR family transcriptional regulator/GNAT superfamily N-acetyltransferase
MNNKFLFGLKLKKIGEELLSQTSKILENSGYFFDKRTIPVLITLLKYESVSVSEMASFLGMTHPAIVQVTGNLTKKGWVASSKSVKDKRITIIKLTRKGEAEFQKIKPLLEEIDDSLESMVNNIDGNLSYSLMKFEKAVKEKELHKILNDRLSKNAMKEIVIITFDKKYGKKFQELNYEWLEKYFEVEEEDKRLLWDPEKEIIKKCGEIFFALLDKEVVGTCAVLKKDPETYELTKMAVTKKAQGKQAGKKLALTSIGFAVEKKAKRMILSTSHKLVAALNLYRNLGFEEISRGEDKRYKRELIHMELDLEIF